MKTLAALVIVASAWNSAIAQVDTTKAHNNEFGLDATGFIRFFTQFQNSSDYSYNPTYYLTYRRYFKPGNIRFGIGGGFSDQEMPSALTGDSSIYKYNSSSMDSRIGWEFKSELSKRWQVYYGLDFRYSFGNTKNAAAFFNGGYAQGYESHFRTVGFAPVLGVRFRINERISILTEMNFSFNISHYYDNRTFYTVIPGSGNLPLPDQKTPDTKSVYTSFAQPISVYFTFNI